MSTLATEGFDRSRQFIRTMVALLAVAIFISYLDRGTLATAAPVIKDELGLTNTQFRILISSFFWIYVPGQLCAAWLVDRINAYRTLALGLMVWSLATAFMGLASGFLSLLALQILLGLGQSASFPASSKLLAEHLPSHRLSFANAMISAGITLGPTVGTFMGGLLLVHAGWRSMFVAFGCVSLFWVVPWLMVARGGARGNSDVRAAFAPDFWSLVVRRELWAAAVGHFAGNYSFYLLLSWLPLYLVRAQGYSITAMAQVAGFSYAVIATTALVGGSLADKWMARGASATLVRKTLIGFSSVTTCLCMLACAFGTPELMVAALLLQSVGRGLGGFNLYAIGQTLAGPTATAKWIGLQNCIGNIAGVVSPIVTGLIVDATGNFTIAFVVAAFISSIGFLAWTVGIRRIEPIRWA
jgi:MFS family permease